MSNRNNVIKRYYVQGVLKLQSPMILGCGEDEIADIQCQRDWDGNVFIPATTLAGVLRHDLLELRDQELVYAWLGTVDDQQTRAQSSLVFLDAFPPMEAARTTTEIWDGVKLNSLTKTAEDQKKYDYEVVHPGQSFLFRCEAALREKQSEQDEAQLKDLLSLIILRLKDGAISFGAKTHRGFGRVTLSDVRRQCFNLKDKTQALAWLDFSWEGFTETSEPEWETDGIALHAAQELTAKVVFEIPDSLLIRRYSKAPQDPDAVMMHYPINGKDTPIIPGTAWAGAFRHALENAARELGKHDEMRKLQKELFGYVEENAAKARRQKKPEAAPSRIRFQLSEVNSGSMMTYTRNKIDRFTGGVANTALFDEKPVYKGMVTLKLTVKSCKDHEVGMVLLALNELGNGIQTIGGDAAIGRGRLQSGPPATLVYKGAKIKPNDHQAYLDALATALCEAENEEGHDHD